MHRLRSPAGSRRHGAPKHRALAEDGCAGARRKKQGHHRRQRRSKEKQTRAEGSQEVMSKITIVWANGGEEEVTCEDWRWDYKNGVLIIINNTVTRDYRYIIKEQVREVRTK